jgi:hypothetical protein
MYERWHNSQQSSTWPKHPTLGAVNEAANDVAQKWVAHMCLKSVYTPMFQLAKDGSFRRERAERHNPSTRKRRHPMTDIYLEQAPTIPRAYPYVCMCHSLTLNAPSLNCFPVCCLYQTAHPRYVQPTRHYASSQSLPNTTCCCLFFVDHYYPPPRLKLLFSVSI